MFRRIYVLLFLGLTFLQQLSATANYDLVISVSQGFTAFKTEDFDTYRSPTGVGIGFRADGFWHSLNLGADFHWYGFPPLEGETSFENSWMITGTLNAGWMFGLLNDPETFLGFGPTVGAGFYNRSISYEGKDTVQLRPILRFSIDGKLRAGNSLVFGTSLNLTGFMDDQTVWGLSVDIDVGYSFGGRR